MNKILVMIVGKDIKSYRPLAAGSDAIVEATAWAQKELDEAIEKYTQSWELLPTAKTPKVVAASDSVSVEWLDMEVVVVDRDLSV